MRPQHVEAFVRKAKDLIESSPLVSWHQRLFEKDRAFLSRKVVGNLYRIKGRAMKAYLWLLIQQEELARNSSPKFRVSDADLMRGLGITRSTAKTYREQLSALGLILVEAKKTGKKREVAITKVKY
jgi:hypothetical protein